MNPAQPEDPIQEEIDGRFIKCQHQPEVWVVPQGGGQRRFQRVEVTRRDNPSQAYRLIEGFRARPLSHGGPLWGYVYLGVILPQKSPGLYVEPKKKSARRVMIKKLFREIVDEDLRRGSKEDPYKEVMRMKQLAGFGRPEGLVEDAYANDHVLGCIDALYDEQYLYIITPYCEKNSLLQHAPLKPTETMSVEAQARHIYGQMLENVEYIHRHHICHRDVDPGNFLVRGDDRVLLNDLAMSFKYNNGLVNHIGAIGKAPYCPPEALQRGHPFRAIHCDIWACTITLWNLVSGQRLYRLPIPADLIFRYAIMAGGLSPEYTNDLVERVIQETNATDLISLTQISQTILTLSPQLLQLLSGVLALRPADRWTLEQIRNCEWMNMPL